jgi:hypothetical protein
MVSMMNKELKMTEKSFCCTSVAGGWQTGLIDSELTFGPVFRKLTELLKWQKENLYTEVA